MTSNRNIADLLKQAGNEGREDDRRAMWNEVVRSQKKEYKLSDVHSSQLEIVKAAATSADAFVEHMTERVRKCASNTGPTPVTLRCLPSLPSDVLDNNDGWPAGLNSLEFHRYICEAGLTRRLASDAWNWFLLILRWVQAGHMGDPPVQVLTGMAQSDIQMVISDVETAEDGSSEKTAGMKQIDKTVRPIVRNTGGMHSLQPTAFIRHCLPTAAWWKAELVQRATPYLQEHMTPEQACEILERAALWETWASAVFLGTPRVAPPAAFAGYLIALDKMGSDWQTQDNARTAAAKIARRCRGLHMHGMKDAVDFADMALS